jgi:hypothetical protein
MYNGWQNYETWVTKLWLDNEESTQRYWADRTRAIWDECEVDGNPFATSQSQRARIALAEALREQVGSEDAPDLGASLYSDLLSAALSEVDWHELANAFLQDAELEEYVGRDK